MKYRTLGRTDLKVSTLCLGSMTWGGRNTQAEGHAQIDRALDQGVTFIDTAEMYPANPGPDDHFGKTEEVIGHWFAKTGRRNEVVLASKVSGNGTPRGTADGAPITSDSLVRALDASLKRLQTDHIDLYQLHWPNRGSYHFRRYWSFDATGRNPEGTVQNIADVLGALQRQIEAGKIRHIGVSNETAWGTAQFLKLSDQHGLPRIATIQNEYSLMCRLFDTDLAELCCNEGVDLLAYSPIAAGILSGKFAGDARPAGSRRAVEPGVGGRITDNIWPAHDAYQAYAREQGLSPVQMAMAFCLSRPFMGAAIFGASTMEQLIETIASADMSLTEAQLEGLNAIYRRHPMPF